MRERANVNMNVNEPSKPERGETAELDGESAQRDLAYSFSVFLFLSLLLLQPHFPFLLMLPGAAVALANQLGPLP